jgi:hypothetical protein
MTQALLQGVELVAFAGIAVAAHTYVARHRRPFADALVATAGAGMRFVMAVAARLEPWPPLLTPDAA